MRGHALTGRTAYLEMDQGTGALRVGGHLTVQGADLLRGAVLALQGRGHDRVTLDLEGVQSVDDAGLRALLTLQETVTMDGGELVLLHTARAAPVGSSSRAAPAHGARAPLRQLASTWGEDSLSLALAHRAWRSVCG